MALVGGWGLEAQGTIDEFGTERVFIEDVTELDIVCLEMLQHQACFLLFFACVIRPTFDPPKYCHGPHQRLRCNPASNKTWYQTKYHTNIQRADQMTLRPRYVYVGESSMSPRNKPR